MALERIPDAGGIGVVKDLSTHDIPNNAWTDASNIRFLDREAMQVYGYGETYASPSYVPQHVFPLTVGGVRHWIYASATKQFDVTLSGGTPVHTDITHVTPRAGVANKWVSTLLSGVPILNMAGLSQVPMAWDLNPANKFIDLPNWQANTYCKSIRSFSSYLVALNITKTTTNYPFMVKWSHPAAPGAVPSSWNEADATKNAGEYDLAHGGDIVIDGLQLRESFMIYKESSCWRMDFIGGSQIFRFTKVLGTSGALNLNCIVEVDGYHVVLTGSDIIAHDGQSANSILDRQMRRTFFSSLDTQARDKCFVFKNPFFNEVLIAFPTIGSLYCNRALVWNSKDRTCSFRELPDINHASAGMIDTGGSGNWAADGEAWDADTTLWGGPDVAPDTARVLMASNNQKLYLLDGSNLADGAPLTGYIERRGLSFGAPEGIKFIRAIRPRIRGSLGGTVVIKVGVGQTPYEDPVWKATMTYTIGDTIRVPCMVSGRYIALRFETGTAFHWRMDSFEVDLDLAGTW